MKKIFFLALILAFLAACGGAQEVSGEKVDDGNTASPAPQPGTDTTGNFNFGGVAIEVNFTDQTTTLKNKNEFRVELAGFFSGLILEPGEEKTETSSSVSIGQKVQIYAWLGDAAISYPNLHGGGQDIIGDVILGSGEMTVNITYDQGYIIYAQMSKINCQFAGRISNSTAQDNNTFYCLNVNDSAMKVELFHIKPNGAKSFISNASLAAFAAIGSQTGQIRTVDWDYAENDTVAVRITNLKTNEIIIYGYYIDVTLNQAVPLSDSFTINIME